LHPVYGLAPNLRSGPLDLDIFRVTCSMVRMSLENLVTPYLKSSIVFENLKVAIRAEKMVATTLIMTRERSALKPRSISIYSLDPKFKIAIPVAVPVNAK
jgi:hypothetical protein